MCTVSFFKTESFISKNRFTVNRRYHPLTRTRYVTGNFYLTHAHGNKYNNCHYVYWIYMYSYRHVVEVLFSSMDMSLKKFSLNNIMKYIFVMKITYIYKYSNLLLYRLTFITLAFSGNNLVTNIEYVIQVSILFNAVHWINTRLSRSKSW